MKQDVASQSIQVLVERYRNLREQPAAWSVDEFGEGWAISKPDGSTETVRGTLAQALIASGACAFESGVALRINTRGVVDRFQLLPALHGWLQETSGSGGAPIPWWEHPAFGRLEEVDSDSFKSLSVDLSRIVLIDDDLCAVSSEPIGSGPTAKQERVHLLLELGDFGHPEPKFYELWATVTTNNGFGGGWHAVGEIVPGLRGAVDLHEGLPVYIRLDRLPEPAQMYADVLSWISGCIEGTPSPGSGEGFKNFEVAVRGSEIEVDFPEEGPYADVTGWISPVVKAQRSAAG